MTFIGGKKNLYSEITLYYLGRNSPFAKIFSNRQHLTEMRLESGTSGFPFSSHDHRVLITHAPLSNIILILHEFYAYSMSAMDSIARSPVIKSGSESQ